MGGAGKRSGHFKASTLVLGGQCEAGKGREKSAIESGLPDVPRRQCLFDLALAEYKVPKPHDCLSRLAEEIP